MTNGHRHRVIRYSEVLLWYAESAARGGVADLSLAKQCLKLVHGRACNDADQITIPGMAPCAIDNLSAEQLAEAAYWEHGWEVAGYWVAMVTRRSDEFRITDDAIALGRTTLIQYRFNDNRQRDDVVSIIDHMVYFFDFRVPGGFKDSGWAFGVSNEQFSTQRNDLVELYASDYLTKTFTLGSSFGVPVWYGEMLNRLLTCSYVYFNGERYVRNDTEVPSINVLVDGLDSFVFTQVLRKAQVIDPTIEALNQAVMRRIYDDDTKKIYRNADISTTENINREI